MVTHPAGMSANQITQKPVVPGPISAQTPHPELGTTLGTADQHEAQPKTLSALGPDSSWSGFPTMVKVVACAIFPHSFAGETSQLIMGSENIHRKEDLCSWACSCSHSLSSRPF